MWKIASGLSVAGSGSEGKFHAFGSSATLVTYEMIPKSDVIGKVPNSGWKLRNEFRLLANRRSSSHARGTSAYPPTSDILDKAGNVSS